MFGLKEIRYPGRVLRITPSFWCDSDNKIFDFLTSHNFSVYLRFAHFGYHQNLVI